MDLSSIKELDIYNGGKTHFKNKEVLDIYYRVLRNSNSWNLGLGYFSLSAFKHLAFPLSKFILENKGVVKVYCNEA